MTYNGVTIKRIDEIEVGDSAYFAKTVSEADVMSEELRYSWLSQIPMKSFVNIHELAKVYLNLVTNRSMTGIVIPVDGGYTLLNR